MDDSRNFQEVRRLFVAARDLSPGDRTAFLDAQPIDDAMRAEVRALLESHDEPSAFLSSVDSGTMSGELDAGAGLPDRIGRFRIVRLIGDGGMGAVYEAEQDSPQRTVAIKVLRPGLGGSGTLRRFSLESEILGRLQHPGIAQIYEAGTFDGTRPYFAMEFIDGVSLTQHAREKNLSERARLELLIEVCGAVRHAHARGVIHRDLKPSNIMVDGEGRSKVLDFGIARASDSETQVTTMGTRFGDLVGTLPYMSPEQLSGDPRAIDARCDVYALGVIAYELLSGELPIDPAGTTIADAILAVKDSKAQALHSLDRRYRGDLSTVVMKALEKDPERRYQSADALADDLLRYLENQPIFAKPPTASYQFRKFASRNKALVGSAGLFVLMLVAGIAVTSLLLVRAIDAEREMEVARDEALAAQQQAEEERAIAEAVNQFLNEDLLAGIDPSKARNRDITMREVLAAASERVDERFADQPIIAGSVHGTLAQMYRNIGYSEEEERHRDSVLRISEREYGEFDWRTLDALNNLATAYMEQGRFGDAVPIYERVYEGRVRAHGKEHESVARIQSNLAAAMLQVGRIEEAVPILEENLAAKRRLFGDEDPSTLTTMNNLAGLYTVRNEYQSAFELYDLVVKGRTVALGEASPRTLFARSARGWAQAMVGSADEAKIDLEDALAIARQRLDSDHPVLLRTMASLSVAQIKLQQFDEAIEILRESKRLHLERYGAENEHTASAFAQLGIAFYEGGHYKEAIEELEHAVQLTDRVAIETHWKRGNTRTWLAMALIEKGSLERAETLLLESLEIYESGGDRNATRREKSVDALVRVYELLGREEDAAKLRERT